MANKQYNRGHVLRRIRMFVEKLKTFHPADLEDLTDVKIALQGYHTALERSGISQSKTKAAIDEIGKLHKQQEEIIRRSGKILSIIIDDGETELAKLQDQ